MNATMTIDQLSTPGAILDAFATAGPVLPRDALKQAKDRWPEVSPHLLAVLQDAADGGELSDRVRWILFFGLFLMAQVRETRAFRPLCILAADAKRIDGVLGDAITEDLSGMFVRLYDGDAAPLRMVIENPDADQFVRNAGIEALAILTASGRIDRSETGRYLRTLYTTLRPQDGNFVWVGWQQAVALLGYEDLVPLVEDIFARGLIDETIMDVDHFRRDFRKAREAENPLESFPLTSALPDHLDDIEAYLSEWDFFRPKPAPGSLAASMPLSVATTIHNPYRGIGRNDPCPCGSGKKFKKCCLEKVR
jgi:hypothetical protein